jgi:L-fucose isomerase-like protein
VRKYVQLFDEHRHDIDGFVVLLPNFGDEIAVIETIQRSKLNVPVLVQACNDEIDKVDLRGRRDCLLRQALGVQQPVPVRHPFSDTTTHTCDIASDEFAADLDRFARVCRTVKGLKNARIGSIGARTGAFQTVRYSEKILQASGVTVVTVDLSEILGAAQAINERRAGSQGAAREDRQPTDASRRTSSARTSSSRPSSRSPSIAGSRKTNATPAPSSAGPACRTTTAAPPACR